MEITKSIFLYRVSKRTGIASPTTIFSTHGVPKVLFFTLPLIKRKHQLSRPRTMISTFADRFWSFSTGATTEASPSLISDSFFSFPNPVEAFAMMDQLQHWTVLRKPPSNGQLAR